jgi:hypothetical protein
MLVHKLTTAYGVGKCLDSNAEFIKENFIEDALTPMLTTGRFNLLDSCAVTVSSSANPTPTVHEHPNTTTALLQSIVDHSGAL